MVATSPDAVGVTGAGTGTGARPPGGQLRPFVQNGPDVQNWFGSCGFRPLVQPLWAVQLPPIVQLTLFVQPSPAVHRQPAVHPLPIVQLPAAPPTVQFLPAVQLGSQVQFRP
jgi:hypothetical protein